MTLAFILRQDYSRDLLGLQMADNTSGDITSLLQEFHPIRNPVMHFYISSSLYIIISVPF